MNTDLRFGWLVVPLIAVSVWFFIDHHRMQQNVEAAKKETELYRSAAYVIGARLDAANSSIEEAKSSAWKSYIEMGYALSNLQSSN